MCLFGQITWSYPNIYARKKLSSFVSCGFVIGVDSHALSLSLSLSSLSLSLGVDSHTAASGAAGASCGAAGASSVGDSDGLSADDVCLLLML